MYHLVLFLSYCGCFHSLNAPLSITYKGTFALHPPLVVSKSPERTSVKETESAQVVNVQTQAQEYSMQYLMSKDT